MYETRSLLCITNNLQIKVYLSFKRFDFYSFLTIFAYMLNPFLGMHPFFLRVCRCSVLSSECDYGLC